MGTGQKLLSYGSLHGGDVYDPATTLLQAAFAPANLLTPSNDHDADGGDHDDDADAAAAPGGVAPAAPAAGSAPSPAASKPAKGGPRTVIDQIVDVACAAYSAEDPTPDKPNPSLVAIEQAVVKVRPPVMPM
jgi:hypothetical protein